MVDSPCADAPLSEGNETIAVSPAHDRDDDLIQCIKAVFHGDYSVKPQGDDNLSVALGRLIRRLQKNALQEMDSAVGLSVQSNETAIFSAHMLDNLRKVDEEAQQNCGGSRTNGSLCATNPRAW